MLRYITVYYRYITGILQVYYRYSTGILQYTTVYYNILQYTTIYYNMLNGIQKYPIYFLMINLDDGQGVKASLSNSL